MFLTWFTVPPSCINNFQGFESVGYENDLVSYNIVIFKAEMLFYL